MYVNQFYYCALKIFGTKINQNFNIVCSQHRTKPSWQQAKPDFKLISKPPPRFLPQHSRLTSAGREGGGLPAIQKEMGLHRGTSPACKLYYHLCMVDFTSHGTPVAPVAGNLWFVLCCNVKLVSLNKFPAMGTIGVGSKVKSAINNNVRPLIIEIRTST